MTVYISNCGKDENGNYTGGTAGDQTGEEWYIRSWYSNSWLGLFVYPDPDVRELIAELAEEAAENNYIGYDQCQRTTFWKQLEKVNYYPKNITTSCEADCSAGVAAIVKAVGYIKSITALQDVPYTMYTGNEKTYLVAAGFEYYTDSKYRSQSDYLCRGSILMSSGHTVIVTSNGTKNPFSGSTSTIEQLEIDGYWGQKTNTRLQQYLGTYVDGIISSQSTYNYSVVKNSVSNWEFVTPSKATGSQCITALQKHLGSNYLDSIDGLCGKNTILALQKHMGTIQDGYLDKASTVVKAMQKALNNNSF